MVAKQSRAKTPHNIALAKLLTTRGTAADAKRGFKRANSELEELIRLANLVPPDTVLPALDMFGMTDLGWRDFLAAAPPLVRLDVLDHVSRPERWVLEADNPPSRTDQGLEGMLRYLKIREAHENLNRIVHHVETGISTLSHIQKLAEYKIETNARGEKKIRLLVDPFTQAIQDVDLRYLRKCPICSQLFFAVRINQAGCGPQHSSALYKRQQRANKTRQRKTKKKASKK